MTIRLGSAEQTAFDNAKDRAVYRVVLETRGLLDVLAIAGESNVGKVQLLDSSCSPIPAIGSGRSVVTGKDSLLTTTAGVWTLDPGGYFVRFEPSSSMVSGRLFSFEATLTPHYGHDCATAEPMNGFSPKDGELLYAEDREVFRVNLLEAGQIHAWTTGPMEAPPYVDLHLAECSYASELQTVDETGNGIVTAVLMPGTYYLFVRPEPRAFGRYTLNVEYAPPPSVDYPSSNVPLD